MQRRRCFIWCAPKQVRVEQYQLDCWFSNAAEAAAVAEEHWKRCKLLVALEEALPQPLATGTAKRLESALGGATLEEAPPQLLSIEV